MWAERQPSGAPHRGLVLSLVDGSRGPFIWELWAAHQAIMGLRGLYPVTFPSSNLLECNLSNMTLYGVTWESTALSWPVVSHMV